jgi:hypothetical protein
VKVKALGWLNSSDLRHGPLNNAPLRSNSEEDKCLTSEQERRNSSKFRKGGVERERSTAVPTPSFVKNG